VDPDAGEGNALDGSTATVAAMTETAGADVPPDPLEATGGPITWSTAADRLGALASSPV
jgi:hypothetical protein